MALGKTGKSIKPDLFPDATMVETAPIFTEDNLNKFETKLVTSSKKTA